MALLLKLQNFVKYLNDIGTQVLVYYKYITEKRFNIIIKGLPNDITDSIIDSKISFARRLSIYFGIRFQYSDNIIRGNYFSVGNEGLIISLIDLSKINYNLYITLSKLPNFLSGYTDCDNYFCSYVEYKSICLYNQKFTYADLYAEIFNKLRGVDFESFPVDSIIKNSCDLLYKTLPKKEWVQAQIQYINSLGELDKRILKFYSTTGDKLINIYLREGMMSNKLYEIFAKSYYQNSDIYQELMGINNYDISLVEIYTKKLIKRLRAIIRNSPSLPAPFYVYRGRTDVIKPEATYTTESFISTSILSKVAVTFSNQQGPKYGTVIRLKVKGKCLLLSNSQYLGEYELLLPFGEKFMLKGNDPKTYEFINSKSQKVLVNYVEYS
jgi:hypothetical protein